MKTKKRTPVSFSADGIHVSLPTGWDVLTQHEIRLLFSLMAVYSGVTLKLAFFLKLTGTRILRQSEDRFVLRFSSGKKKKTVAVSPDEMSQYLTHLEWMDDPGVVPVRLDSLCGHQAVDPCFHGVSFGTFIQIENLYQGYIYSKDPAPLLSLVNILYPGDKIITAVSVPVSLMVTHWLIQVKAMFASQFDNFFKPAGSSPDDVSMLEIMNCEIRILTGGDVSKEAEILGIDCWRALTELDFKAKEAEDFRCNMPKTH